MMQITMAYDKVLLTDGGVCGILSTALEKKVQEAVEGVRTVGKIDRKMFADIATDIATDEVVITGTQIGHIRERHPDDFERVLRHIPMAVSDPDYILDDPARATAIIFKRIEEDDERYRIILRLATSSDEDGLKNSIITAFQISEKKWGKYLRNKRIVYKKE